MVVYRERGKIMKPELQAAIEVYCETLSAKSLEAMRGLARGRGVAEESYDGLATTFCLEPGSKGGKYVRIVTMRGGEIGSVHAFVQVATGALCKTGGWKGPARGGKGASAYVLSKYNLLDPESMQQLLAEMDVYGGHLYGGSRIPA
jgi:hypothetical protein